MAVTLEADPHPWAARLCTILFGSDSPEHTAAWRQVGEASEAIGIMVLKSAALRLGAQVARAPRGLHPLLCRAWYELDSSGAPGLAIGMLTHLYTYLAMCFGECCISTETLE